MYDFETIFESFVNGDIAPFYRHFYPVLLVYASRYLGSDLAYMAEDCVQDAVMDTYLIRDRFENSRAWYAYLLKCVSTKALMQLRKLNTRLNYAESGTVEDTAPAFELELLEQETLSRLNLAVNSLTDTQREILRMSFSEGLKNAEIAARLGVAEITVKKAKAKILTALRRMLSDIPPAALIAYLPQIF